jgi:hypothetical protein
MSCNDRFRRATRQVQRLSRPVVLVSSNQEDVPFDLRHIRVILYDQQDPFWGQKLIDKVADNITSAIKDPEDAIFRADEV